MQKIDARNAAILVAFTLIVISTVGTLAAGPAAAYISNTQQVTVTHVVDGDTIDIQYPNGSTDTVRFLGIDTPETYANNTPDEYEGVPDTQVGKDCLHQAGEEATSYMTNQIEGKQVTLAFDSESDHRGYYGRLLAYVEYGGTDYNYQLVQTGRARVYDSTFSKSDSFYAAESDAQNAERHLWQCRAVGNGSANVTVSDIHADAAGNDNDDLDDEYVTLKNTGSSAVNLSGWTVSDEADHTYTFSSGVSLGAGETITLHTGSGSDSASDVYWGRSSAVWNNGGDTVYVRTGTGTQAATRSY